MNYLISLHIIAFVAWFAGLFYLPRLFVYHAMTSSAEVSEQFKVMEHKLYFYIMMPAMAITIFSGLYLLTFYLLAGHTDVGWLWLKLFLVLLLTIYHFVCGYFITEFKANQNRYTHRFYRFFNEVPTVLLILIIWLAIVRPF